MDNLTHTLTGLFLSRAGLNRFTPRATWILLLAANAPDVDIVSAAGGSLNYLHYHRNFTHSLLFAPVLAVVCALVVRLVRRKPAPTPTAWIPAIGIALIGILSHLLLDLTNVYGVRILLPFDVRWFRWDLTNVVDLWIWAALLLSLLGPFVAKLVGSEIGAKPRGPAYPGRGFAIFALAFLLIYNYGRYLLHDRATATLDARIYNGAAPIGVAAFPGPASPLLWRGLTETRDAYYLFDLNLLQPFDPASGQVAMKAERTAAIEAANRTPAFREYLTFSQFPLWRALPAADIEGATRVEVMDLRFGSPASPGFVCTVILDKSLQVIRSWFQFGSASPR
ncbi:MAG: metal-dependent hydrolase [Acidobacteriota bacterium]|nr:metal-dependent hydrolase [Acidobacteriota bacterium]